MKIKTLNYSLTLLKSSSVGLKLPDGIRSAIEGIARASKE